jgi:hypothetical protein
MTAKPPLGLSSSSANCFMRRAVVVESTAKKIASTAKTTVETCHRVGNPRWLP